MSGEASRTGQRWTDTGGIVERVNVIIGVQLGWGEDSGAHARPTVQTHSDAPLDVPRQAGWIGKGEIAGATAESCDGDAPAARRASKDYAGGSRWDHEPQLKIFHCHEHRLVTSLVVTSRRWESFRVKWFESRIARHEEDLQRLRLTRGRNQLEGDCHDSEVHFGSQLNVER
ncbi:hypothetical protein FA15DRAFT_731598 [Coprinopsis marcescibilis]|uniref:Uncharacterized protein n=1 Tax=Coprinopsis marcescibilis TaxID=230819 RepID=A0A5C3KE43_COPMA|nr:hypothetical protein FA15DRAFT_731598 [Coprinopsis marcescibilis]